MNEETLNIEEELAGYNEEPTMLLSLDDGTDLVCIVVSIYEIDGQEYIALIPEDQSKDEEAEEVDVYIYRFSEDEDGNPVLDNIMDDDEYEQAVDTFNALFEEEGEI